MPKKSAKVIKGKTPGFIVGANFWRSRSPFCLWRLLCFWSMEFWSLIHLGSMILTPLGGGDSYLSVWRESFNSICLRIFMSWQILTRLKWIHRRICHSGSFLESWWDGGYSPRRHHWMQHVLKFLTVVLEEHLHRGPTHVRSQVWKVSLVQKSQACRILSDIVGFWKRARVCGSNKGQHLCTDLYLRQSRLLIVMDE